MINPALEPVHGELVYDWEGCLSIPDLRGLVPRHPAVRVHGLDRDGKTLDYRAEDYEARWIGSGTHGDADCARLEIRARPGIESVYEKMISCVEPARAIILWTDFYERGAVVKRLEIDIHDVRVVADRFIPFSMTMSTPRRNSQTVSVTGRYELRADIPDELFSTWNLEAGDARRDRSRSASELDQKSEARRLIEAPAPRPAEPL